MSELVKFLLIWSGAATLAGGLFLAIGIGRRRMSRGWVRTTGQVVGTVDASNGERPTFRWWDHTGAEHVRTSGVATRPAPRPGAVVRVRYDPEAPHRAVIDSFMQRGTGFILIGGLILAVALIPAGVAAASHFG